MRSNIIKVMILETKRGYTGWNNLHSKYKHGTTIVLIDGSVTLMARTGRLRGDISNVCTYK